MHRSVHKRKWRDRFLIFFSASLLFSCSTDFKDKNTANGLQGILEQADDFLTAGNCDGAIDVLSPVIHSTSVTPDAISKYSSAYACKGGMNFPNMIAGLAGGSSGIWAALVKGNYSISNTDGKVTALDQAAAILIQAANPTGSYDAQARTSDQNIFMIFLQLNIIATTIGPLGVADQKTGNKTTSISAKGAALDKCNVEIAFATINESLSYVDSSALSSVSTAIKKVCNAALGTVTGCPQTKVMSTCIVDATSQAQGALLINALDGLW